MKSIIWRKSWNVFIKNLNFFSIEEILDDMGVSKLSAKVFFFKVNYSFKIQTQYLLERIIHNLSQNSQRSHTNTQSKR